MSCMNAISNNPYRILGVYTNASVKELSANITKIKAYSQIGKNTSFSSDFPLVLGSVIRNADAVSKAYSDISLSEGRLMYGLLWFNKMDHVDEIAFNYLNAGDIEKASELFSKINTSGSFVNRAVCALLQENVILASYLFSKLVENDLYDDFQSNVIGIDRKFSKEEFTKILVDTLIKLFPNYDWFNAINSNIVVINNKQQFIDDELHNSYFSKQFKSVFVTSITQSISSKLDQAEKTNLKDPSACLRMAQSVSNLIGDFRNLRTVINASDVRYITLSDRTATILNRLCVGYYNNTNNSHHTKTIYPYAEKALDFACSSKIKKLCQENLEVLNRSLANEEEQKRIKKISTDVDAVKKLISDYEESNKGISSLMDFLRKCNQHLQSIRKKIRDKDISEQISSNVVNFALNIIIDEVNNAYYYKSDIISKASSLMSYMENFEMNYKTRCRFVENFDTLNRMQLRDNKSGFSREQFLFDKKNNKDNNEDHLIRNILIACLLGLILFIFIGYCANKNEKISQNNTSGVNNTTSVITSDSTAIDSVTVQEDNKIEDNVEEVADEYEQEKLNEEKWLKQYKGNSLKTGATPYRSKYGKNSQIGDSEIEVTAAYSSDAVVIIKNSSGKVVKHAYIKANKTYTFTVTSGEYQVFFIQGNSWCPHKKAPNGCSGFFLENVSYGKDDLVYIPDYKILTYTLHSVVNGNFSMRYSDPSEAF